VPGYDSGIGIATEILAPTTIGTIGIASEVDEYEDDIIINKFKGPDPEYDPKPFKFDTETLIPVEDCRRPQWLPLAVLMTMLSVWMVSRIPHLRDREGFLNGDDDANEGHRLLFIDQENKVERAIRWARKAISRNDRDAVKSAMSILRQALVDRYSRSIWASWSMGVAALALAPW
jgi:hypothetical protein